MRAFGVFALVGLGLALAAGDAQARPKPARVILGIAGAALSPLSPAIRFRALKPRRHVIHRSRRAISRTARPLIGAMGVAGATIPGVFWPYAYDDLFNYALGRSDGERFWRYGAMEIVAGLGPAIAPSDSAPRRGQRDRRTAGSPCLSANDVGWPASWIAARTQPTATQNKLVADVGTALRDAATYLTASCGARAAATASSDHPATMNAADMVRSRIWAMRQAVIIVRKPLKEWHASLSEAQKSRLAPPQRRARKDADTVANLCRGEDDALAMPASPDTQARPGAPAIPFDSRAIKPLHELLKASCPRNEPKTVTERLDAMADRLVAMEYAVLAMGPTLRAQQVQQAPSPTQQDAAGAAERSAPGEPP